MRAALIGFFLGLLMIPAMAFGKSESQEYFEQFLYQDYVDTSDPEEPLQKYKYVMTGWSEEIPWGDGTFLFYQINLFLLKDYKFRFSYDEIRGPKNGEMPAPHGCRMIEGTWSVVGDKLLLPGIGYAEKTTVMGKNALLFTIEKSPKSPHVTGRKISGTFEMNFYGIKSGDCGRPD